MTDTKNLTLYKFRPLGDCESFKRARDIITTGKFWCSPIWELNDPMEGVFTFYEGESQKVLDRIFSDKSRYRICSFSGKPALKDPKMWGYYGNGFRGIAVEIQVPAQKVREVKYCEGMENLLCTCERDRDSFVKRILTTKLKLWSHENEYRYLDKEDGNSGCCREIGRITSVYFGEPYWNTENARQIRESSQALQDYYMYREQLKQIAEKKGISCRSVFFSRENDKWEVKVMNHCKGIALCRP